MGQGVTIDSDSIPRIRRAVLATEAAQLSQQKNGGAVPALFTILAKITSGTNPYAWTQQRVKADGTAEDMPNAITGTASSNGAYESHNDNRVPANEIVVLTRSVVIDATTSKPRTIWLFDWDGHAIPSPTALYQVFSVTGVSGGVFTRGWDWVKAHE